MLKSNIQREFKLPSNNFLITKDLLKSMIKFKINSTRRIKKSELRNAIKINLMNCIKHKRLYNKISAKDILEGFIYVVSHPNYPNIYKIGRCLDIHERLIQYQVYCPFKHFKREFYIPVFDMRYTEQLIKDKFKEYNVSGEWYNIDIDILKKFIYSKEIDIEL